MDNLLFKFDQATDLEQDQNTPKFSTLYKNNDKLVKRQQQRRNEILSNRLSKRDKLIASIRRLVSDVAKEDDGGGQNAVADISDVDCGNDETFNDSSSTISTRDEQSSTNQSMAATTITTTSTTITLSPYASSNSANNNNNKPAAIEDRKFRNKAMLSEWLVDRPMDFESEWVLKATPIGRRCLVIAKKGETVAYSRTGKFIKAFQSALPGGSHVHISQCRRQFAIVDCIYVQHNNTFYLMDALAWNEHKIHESEASFRFFWLQSRYNENQEKFITLSSKNQSRFYCLKTYSASDQDILTALHNDTLIRGHNLQLDGLLFFHIRGPYVPGANPLVLWIKPEMANRVLNVNK